MDSPMPTNNEVTKKLNHNDENNDNQKDILPSRSRAFLESLPKFIFELPGSYSIWKNLIGFQLNHSTMRRFHKKIQKLDANEKYAFAVLVTEYGIKNALEMVPIVDESTMIENDRKGTVERRTFMDVSTQYDQDK